MSDDTVQQPISMLSTKAGPLTVRAWLFMALIAFVSLMYYEQLPPDISNAEYVQNLLSKNTLQRTAGTIIRDARPKNTSSDASTKAADDAKWTAIATDLADCMESWAQTYLTSGDPYLDRHFSPDTPRVISEKLLTACNAIQYLPKDTGE